jgi:hypothetical protein
MMPLLLGTLLEAVGVPEAIAVVAVAGLAVWHLRSATQMLVTAGFAAKVVGAVSVVLVAAWAGLIPGVSMAVAVEELAAFLGGVWEIISGGLAATVEVIR